MPEPHRTYHDRYLSNYRRTGEAHILGVGRELRGRRKDGSTMPLDLAVSEFKIGDERFFAGFLRDITARKRAEQELDAAYHDLAERTATAERQAEQLRRMTRDLTQAEQRERHRLARLLHDHLQQLLVAAKMQVQFLQRQSLEEHLDEPVTTLRELLDESISDTRSLATELYPQVLRAEGWVAALEWLSDWMLQKHGLDVNVQADPQAEPVDEHLSVLLFQGVRELLFNIVKHAGVSEARVTSSYDETGRLRIVITDEGRGFAPATKVSAETSGASPTGLGLSSIKERLQLSDGHMQIDSCPDKGTRVTLLAPSVPVEAA